MWFSAFSDIFCAGQGQALSLKIWYPTMSLNAFNSITAIKSVAYQFKRENLGQRICVESWLCSERSYNSHKGIYSKIFEFQKALMTSQRSHVMTMWFSAFSDIFCAEQSQVLSLWKPGTHWMKLNSNWFSYCYKIWCRFLPQEQPTATSLAISLAICFATSFAKICEVCSPLFSSLPSWNQLLPPQRESKPGL